MAGRMVVLSTANIVQHYLTSDSAGRPGLNPGTWGSHVAYFHLNPVVDMDSRHWKRPTMAACPGFAKVDNPTRLPLLFGQSPQQYRLHEVRAHPICCIVGILEGSTWRISVVNVVRWACTGNLSASSEQ